MELDLDAVLQSEDTSTSDDDEDDDHHLSTVDELLLIDSDCSSPSSSPRSYRQASSPQNNSTLSALNSSDSSQLTRPLQLATDGDRPISLSKFSSVSQFSSGDTFSASRQLHPLFGAVRSNAKPGAALAAAAAASRLIPTPHAAAIKLKRKNSGTESLDPKASTGSEISYESGTGLEISHLNEKAVGDDEDLKQDTLETAPVELAETFEVRGELITENESEDATCEEMETDAANASELDAIDLVFRDDTRSSVAESEIGSPLMLDKDCMRSAQDDSGQDTERNDSSKTELCEKDVEFDLQAEVNDMSAQADVSVVMDGIDLHQGSEKNDGGNSLKPLQFAEELEKKHAFTGL